MLPCRKVKRFARIGQHYKQKNAIYQRFFVIYAQIWARKMVFMLLNLQFGRISMKTNLPHFVPSSSSVVHCVESLHRKKIPATRRWRGERETVVEDESAHGRDKTADSSRGIHQPRATIRICWKQEDREADNRPSPGGGGARSRYSHGDFAVSNRLRPAPMRGGRPYRKCVRGGAYIRSTACR